MFGFLSSVRAIAWKDWSRFIRQPFFMIINVVIPLVLSERGIQRAHHGGWRPTDKCQRQGYERRRSEGGPQGQGAFISTSRPPTFSGTVSSVGIDKMAVYQPVRALISVAMSVRDRPSV